MSLFGWITEETPKFTLLKTIESAQLRRYAPQIRIRSTNSIESPRGYGFRPLARYIFGGNDQSKYISMTAPVLETMVQSEQTMDFVLPSCLKMDQLPKPNDSNVEILEIPEQDFLVITFNGNPRSEDLVQSKLQELREIAQQNSVEIEGNYILAIYNPPWTIHYFRKNEILIPAKNC